MYGSFVAFIRVIESIDVESFLRHWTLEVDLLDNVFPQLGGVVGSWHSACHAGDDRTFFRHDSEGDDDDDVSSSNSILVD
jgi:hypothetical protein